MRRSRGLRGCLLGVVFCLTLLSSAYAQDTYRLVNKSAVGDVAQVEEELSMDVTMKPAAGLTTVPTLHTGMLETKKYQQSVLSKNANGEFDSLSRTYTAMRSVNKNDKGQNVSISPLLGKTVLIQRKGKEVVIDSPGEVLPQDVRSSLQDALKEVFNFVPDHAVAVGDEWEIDPQKIRRSAELKDVKNAKVHVKLLDIVTFDGHRSGHVHINMRYDVPIEEDTAMQLDLGGDGYVALDIERMLEMDLRGPILFIGSRFGKGADQSSGEGKAHLKLAWHWEKVAGKAIAAGKL